MIRGGNLSDDLDSLLAAEFQTYILQLELLYFSASGHGEFLDKENVFRNFVTGNFSLYNPQIQISAESETKRSIFREKDKTKRSKKESAQHSKSRNKSFVMTSVSAL